MHQIWHLVLHCFTLFSLFLLFLLFKLFYAAWVVTFLLILLISIVRDRSNVIGKQLMNNEQSVGGDWMDGVLDCYDFQSTCGAKKAILFTALSFVWSTWNWWSQRIKWPLGRCQNCWCTYKMYKVSVYQKYAKIFEDLVVIFMREIVVIWLQLDVSHSISSRAYFAPLYSWGPPKNIEAS